MSQGLWSDPMPLTSGVFPDDGAAWIYLAVGAIALVALRWRPMATRAGGLVLAVVVASGLVFLARSTGTGLADGGLVGLLAMGTAALGWDSGRRSFRQHSDVGSPPPPPPAAREPFFGVGELAIGGVAILLASLPALFGGLGASGPTAAEGSVSRLPPISLRAFQEMALFLPTWSAMILAPLVIVAGLAALPLLTPRSSVAPVRRDQRDRSGIQLVLFLWSFLGLAPLLVATFLRPPSVARPGEPWSAWVWSWLGEPSAPWLRELPGLLLLVVWFGVIPVVLPRYRRTSPLFGRLLRELGPVRYSVVMTLLLLILVLPLTMAVRWLLGVGPLVSWPEAGISF